MTFEKIIIIMVSALYHTYYLSYTHCCMCVCADLLLVLMRMEAFSSRRVETLCLRPEERFNSWPPMVQFQWQERRWGEQENKRYRLELGTVSSSIHIDFLSTVYTYHSNTKLISFFYFPLHSPHNSLCMLHTCADNMYSLVAVVIITLTS